MPVFAYTALTTAGEQTTGTLSAGSRSAAIDQVAAKGLHPVDVVERAEGGAGWRMPSSGRVKPAQVESFTRELANLLAGGVSLSRALHILSREASAPGAKKVWSAIHDSVVDGMPLADAMAQHPQVFPPINVAMVHAGETGGFLEVVLNQIADFQAREADLKGRVKAAMIYPIVLAVFCVGVLIFLLTYFIPQFRGIFNQFGGSLPYLTQVVVGASNVVRSYGLVVAAVIAGLVLLVRRAVMSDQGRRAKERFILKSPALGYVASRFALVRFCRMLGTLLGSGVPLVTALKTAREAIGNQTLSDAVGAAIEDVRSGASLARSLGQCPTLFPPSVVEMVAVAEETGRLDKELVRLAATYEVDLDRRLRMLVALLEPVMLFLMAAIIGTVVVSMLLPVFSMSDLIK